MSMAMTQDAIVLFGDSITQRGWEPGAFAQKLAYVYCRKIDVINRGFSGYNTGWAIPIFKTMFERQDNHASNSKCKLLTIWFGANDAVLPGKLQHVPLDKYKMNLSWMIDSLKNPSSEFYSPQTRIILITPPPIHVATRARDLSLRNPPQEIDRSKEHTKMYAEACREVGAALKVPVLDAWNALLSAVGYVDDNLASLLEDGLHLNEKGYKIIFDELVNLISSEYPELHHERLPQIFPSWDMVDPKDPVKSIVSQYVDV